MEIKKMWNKGMVLMVALIVVMLATVSVGCSSDSGENEGPDEHGAGSGGGESSEGGHSEAGGEGSESGDSASPLALNETYDVTKNGVRTVLSYDKQTDSFVGSVKNISNSTVTRARVEVHLQNNGVLLATGAELGPTTPTDLAPGQTININLQSNNHVFDGWVAHCEVGAAEGGEDSGGGEGSEGGHSEAGGEGSEGNIEFIGEGSGGHGAGGEGGGEGGSEGSEGGSEGGLESLMSSPVTPITQTWSGNLGGLDVTGSYDANTGAVTTVVTNTLSKKLCYVYTEPHLKMGANTVGEMGPGLVGDLNPGETKTSVLYISNEPELAGVKFDGLKMHMEVFACSGPGLEGGAPTINPITGLPGSPEGGSEGGSA